MAYSGLSLLFMSMGCENPPVTDQGEFDYDIPKFWDGSSPGSFHKDILGDNPSEEQKKLDTKFAGIIQLLAIHLNTIYVDKSQKISYFEDLRKKGQEYSKRVRSGLSEWKLAKEFGIDSDIASKYRDGWEVTESKDSKGVIKTETCNKIRFFSIMHDLGHFLRKMNLVSGGEVGYKEFQTLKALCGISTPAVTDEKGKGKGKKIEKTDKSIGLLVKDILTTYGERKSLIYSDKNKGDIKFEYLFEFDKDKSQINFSNEIATKLKDKKLLNAPNKVLINVKGKNIYSKNNISNIAINKSNIWDASDSVMYKLGYILLEDGTFYVRPTQSSIYKCVVGEAPKLIGEEKFIDELSASEDILVGYIKEGEF